MKAGLFLILTPVSILLSFCIQRTESSAAYKLKQTKSELHRNEFVSYVTNEESGFVLEKTVGEFVFTVRHIPSEYMALRQLEGEVTDTTAFKAKAEELNELLYFVMTIEHKSFKGELLSLELKDRSEFAARLDYFSFKMQNDITLSECNEVSDCVIYHFERSYSLSPKLTFNVAFLNAKNNCDKVFSFEDTVFGNGIINVRFDKTIFTNVPKIKTS